MPAARPECTRPGITWRGVPLLLLALVIFLWVAWEGQRLIRADFTSLGARKQVGAWISGESPLPTDAEWAEARDAIAAALAVTPDNPALQEQMGDLHAVAGRRLWADGVARTPHFQRAEASYRQALALRPGDPQTWASLAMAYHGQGQTGAPLHQAWARALALGPNEGHVQPMLLETALATWATASPEMQRWTLAFFDASAPAQRKAINDMAKRYGLQLQADDDNASRPTAGASSPISSASSAAPAR